MTMEKNGADDGFAKWLQEVDVGYTASLAKAAARSVKVTFFARVSSRVSRSTSFIYFQKNLPLLAFTSYMLVAVAVVAVLVVVVVVVVVVVACSNLTYNLHLNVCTKGSNAKLEGGGFNIYFKYQGIADNEVVAALNDRVEDGSMTVLVMKPGRLERGVDLRAKRPHEVAQYQSSGPGLDTSHLAAVMIEEAHVQPRKPGVLFIYDDEIRKIGQTLMQKKPLKSEL